MAKNHIIIIVVGKRKLYKGRQESLK